jgi:serine/threonine protein kinase
MPAPRKQPVPFGRYLLLDRINVGGMAEVWRGKESGFGGLGRLVAVKRILPNIAEDEEFEKMFQDEARISVQLSHANIAQIYAFEFERLHNSYYIAMEYVAGKDLRSVFDRCRKAGFPAPVPLVCHVMAKVCDALDYAHKKKDATGRELNIVHRDISPQNILLSYDGDVKVIDFGVAKAAGKATRTQAGILKGKFGYMSPEQVRAQEIDWRSDIFSIGVCLYELLTNERLFTGETDLAVLDKVRSMEIPPPSAKNPQVSPALDEIVLKALARNLPERYAHAGEMSEALQRLLITSGTLFSRKELANFMQATFAEEVEKEAARVAGYADLVPPPQDTGAASAPSLPRRSGPAEPSQVPPTNPLGLGGGDPSGPRRASRVMPVMSAPPKRLVAPGNPLDPGAEPEAKTQFTDFGAADETTQGVEATAVTVRPDALSAPPRASGGAPAEAVRPTAPTAMDPGQRDTGRAQVLESSGATSSDQPTDANQRPWPRLRNLSVQLLGKLSSQLRGKNKAWRRMGLPAAAGGLLGIALVAALVAARGRTDPQYIGVAVPSPLLGRAHVWVNDEAVGSPDRTPAFYAVQPGRVKLRVKAEGHVPFELREPVEVKAGGPPIVVSTALIPENPPAQVVVATTPADAEIALGGQVVRPAGKADLYEGEVPVGRELELLVRAPGYRDVTRTLRADSSVDAQVMKVVLERESDDVAVRLTSKPSGASVYQRAQLVGHTPLMVKPVGGAVTVKQHCYAEQTVAMPAVASAGMNIHVDLRRQSGCR